MKNRNLYALAGLMLITSPALAQPYNVTVAGYSPGGLVSTIGAGMDKALATQFPGSTVTYQTSSGGLANGMLVSTKKVPMGLIGDHEFPIIYEGRPPYKTPVKNLRLVFKPYVGATRFQISHVLVSKEFADRHGVKTFADLGTKKPPIRIAVNRPGNADGDVGLAFLDAIGFPPAAIQKAGGQVIRAASGEQTSLMLDRRIDGLIFGISYRHPRVLEIEKGQPIVMLPFDEATSKKVADKWGGQVCQVKAGEYSFLDGSSYSVCMGLGLYVRDDADEALVYNMTKAMYEQIGAFHAAHRLLKQFVTAQTMAEPGIVPHHPGAARYMREKGLLK